MADSGINNKVTKAVWDEAVGTLVLAIKAGHLGDGFVAAVEQRGPVRATHFPPGH